MLATLYLITFFQVVLGSFNCEELILFATAEVFDGSYVKFRLYTRQNPNIFQSLSNASNIAESAFDRNLPTVIFNDGWNSAPDDEASMVSKSVFLTAIDCNFIVVDWRKGSKTFYVPIAIQHAYASSKEIAKFITLLKVVTGIHYSTIHYIGMSLGAHIAGFVGKRVKIGRITGLDPAGPCFIGYRKKHRLHYTDADFVDVVLSSPGGFGIDLPVGDVNFRLNNKKIQNGCETEFFNGIKCSHARALLFFLNTMLVPECLPVGYACETYKQFIRGSCYQCGVNGTGCAVLGVKAPMVQWNKINSPAEFYLNTSYNFNYCLEHYHIEVKLAEKTSNDKAEEGRLILRLNGDKISTLFLLSEATENFEQGNNHTYLITSQNKLGSIKSGEIYWYSIKPRDDSHILLKCVKIVPMNNIERDRTMLTTALGMEMTIPVPAGKSVLLHEIKKC